MRFLFMRAFFVSVDRKNWVPPPWIISVFVCVCVKKSGRPFSMKERVRVGSRGQVQEERLHENDHEGEERRKQCKCCESGKLAARDGQVRAQRERETWERCRSWEGD